MIKISQNDYLNQWGKTPFNPELNCKILRVSRTMLRVSEKYPPKMAVISFGFGGVSAIFGEQLGKVFFT